MSCQAGRNTLGSHSMGKKTRIIGIPPGFGQPRRGGDIDAHDPVQAPGVGTPVPGGSSCGEAHLLMEIFTDSATVGSMDLVEINPILDDANRTAKLAVELTLSALGKRIL